eukprot:2893029-Pyramimonas_sp.AAC.1
MFLRGVPSYDEYVGWAEISQLLKNLPAEPYETYLYKHLEIARYKLKDKHWAYQAYAVLECIGTVDETGMKKNRLQLKKL